MDLLSALRSGTSVFAAELRPPRAELAAGEGMDAWIDTYHAVTRLTRRGTFVFLTDSAVGAQAMFAQWAGDAGTGVDTTTYQPGGA